LLNFLRNLGFTKQDIILSFFLLAVFVAGLVVNYTGIGGALHFSYSKADVQLETEIRSSFAQQEINRIKDSLEKINDNQPVNFDLSPDEKININSAYPDDLVRLPGIGEVIAERIVDYRQQVGKFSSIEQLMNVKGIGRKKLEKLRNHVILE
jgi:comEA protein